MKYYVVNRNSLENITQTTVEKEDAFHFWDKAGIKYSLFGPTVFCFQTKKQAAKFAHSILDEDITLMEHRLGKLRTKKAKLNKE